MILKGETTESPSKKLLQYFGLNRPLDPKNDERMLPFGDGRKLPALSIINNAKDIPPLTQPTLRTTSQVDCQLANKEDASTMKQRMKTGAAPMTLSRQYKPTLYFDPSALIFYHDHSASNKHSLNGSNGIKLSWFQNRFMSPFPPLNLSSNLQGTATGDKQHMSVVLQSSIWLMSLDALKDPNLPVTLNNKLKFLKCAEFFSQEWMNLNFKGIDVVGLVRDERRILSTEPNKAVMIRRKGSLALRMAVYNSKGLRKFPLSPRDLQRFWPSSCKQQQLSYSPGYLDCEEINLDEGDIIIAVRSIDRLEFVDSIAFFVASSTTITDDLETIISEKFPLNEISGAGLTISRVILPDSLDGIFNNQARLSLRHLYHLDSRKAALTSFPKPGPFGVTTRHSLIQRPSYYASLHQDASKINRFKPTIDYIIKKMCSSNAVGRWIDNDLLPRLSEIQYFANCLIVGEKGRIGVGGGAKIFILKAPRIGEEGRKFKNGHCRVVLIERGQVEEVALQPGDHLLFLSPHFTSDLFNPHSVQLWLEKYCDDHDVAKHNWQDFLAELVAKSRLDLSNPKLSVALYAVEAKDFDGTFL